MGITSLLKSNISADHDHEVQYHCRLPGHQVQYFCGVPGHRDQYVCGPLYQPVQYCCGLPDHVVQFYCGLLGHQGALSDVVVVDILLARRWSWGIWCVLSWRHVDFLLAYGVDGVYGVFSSVVMLKLIFAEVDFC